MKYFFVIMIPAALSFVITALSGFLVIPYLKRLKFGQTILDIGPKWHKSKEGTPTMGGVMMVFGVIIAFAVGCTFALASLKASSGFQFRITVSGLVMALLMGSIGFFDDYIKVVKKRNLGLTARQKTFLQLLVAAAYLVTLAFSGMNTTYIPFIGEIDIMHGAGLIFWPVALMFIYGFTNAVNLTDGVDGLASSVTLVVALSFTLISVSLVKNYLPMTLSASLFGATAGFLIWNAKPAKVFMGDTGSMFLGGMVVAISFSICRPVLLILMGAVYFAEAISVMLQVAYFKKTKKRLFKMAPIHHHFEMSGWSEQKVDFVFSLVTALFCFAAILLVVFSL